MTEIHFEPPGADSPGYLRLLRELGKYKEIMTRMVSGGDYQPEEVDGLVGFLAQFVVGAELEEAKELLWDASANQLGEMVGALSGGDPLAGGSD